MLERLAQHRVWTAFAIVAMALFSVATVAAFVGDYVTLGIVTNGVTVGSTQLGGMNAAQVRTAVEQAVSAPMMQPLSVTAADKAWTIDPRTIVTVDADAMVEQAYAPVRDAALVQRVYSRITGAPLAAVVKPVYAIETSTVDAWVAQAATEVDRKPKNAKRAPVGYKIKITPAVYGTRLDQTASVDAIANALGAEAALANASRAVALPVTTVAPSIVETSFKNAIIVSLSQCKIRLYKGSKLVKTYLCAPGQPAFPTPTGDFTVVRKLHNAPWYNPGSDWAKDMPPSIPAGPYNPMGVHKIGINYPGVFFHGIPPSEFSSIGTHASHGCMRMMPASVADLYKRVKVGDPVYIRQ